MIELAPNNPYGLALSTPVMTAAGCFGFGVEYARSVPLERIGAMVTRGVAMRGLSAPPLVETPSGLLYAGDWAARGLAAVLERHAEVWASWRTPVLLNVVADHAAVAGAIEGVEGIAGLELSVAEPLEAAKTTAAVRAVTLLPLLVKLPAHESLAEIARAVVAAGADALTITSLPRAQVIHPSTGQTLSGRLVGPATRPVALQAFVEARTAVEVPLVAGGGVMNADNARHFLDAGALAVQVGSALLSDPWAAVKIGDEVR
jgi:dihydroorotate dehydrogenase (NAD+) catalytic subunit